MEAMTKVNRNAKRAASFQLMPRIVSALLLVATAIMAAFPIEAANASDALTSPTKPSIATRPVGTVKVPTGNPASKAAKTSSKATKSTGKPKMTMAIFLDRLMMAESSGRARAKNPLSSATGAFQFIESTWLSVLRRHFPKIVEGKSRAEILALRYDPDTSRKAAEAYTRDNAAVLAADGHAPTFPNLRLAFLLGAGGASRVLAMEPNAPIAPVLGRAVMTANPFMRGMTAKDLVKRAARDISAKPTTLAGIKVDKRRLKRARPRGPRIRVRCNLRRPSCRRWLALKKRQLKRAGSRRARKTRRRTASRR